MLKEKTYFRINPVNFRTRMQDMEELFGMLVEACRETVPLASSAARETAR